MTIEEVVTKIQQARPAKKPMTIGIEGFGGAGKSTLAEKLKSTLGNAYVVQTDDFIIKKKLTLVSPDHECYDLERLERQVLLPIASGQPAAYEKLIWADNKLSAPIEIPSVDYLIVEGITAYKPEIAKYFDYKIWVDTPIDIATERGRQKDAGTENEQHWDLWSKNDLAYKEKYYPDKVADLIYENG